MSRVVKCAAAGMLMLLASACASHEARDTERMLAAAGFRMLPATTPEMVGELRALPQHRMLIQPASAASADERYVYADPGGCGCLYVGDQTAYLAFSRLAHDRTRAKKIGADQALDWGGWQPDAVVAVPAPARR